MSGGHWQYYQFKLEEYAELSNEALLLLAAIEHTLDWGISGDTCQACAETQVLAMLKSFFDEHTGETSEHQMTWQAIYKEDGRPTNPFRCERHKEARR